MSYSDFDSNALPDALGPIVESFLARLRRGERPSPQEYADRYPEHAEQIFEVFPPLAEMEMAGMAGDSLLHSAAKASAAPDANPERCTTSRRSDAPVGPSFDRLGDYRIIREIGGGGMGIVYEAEREALRSRVALKVMHPKLRNRSDYLRWFLREAQAAAGLHHTNIVTVFDYGQHDGICYYAMQYISGHSLDKVLEEVKRLKQEPECSRENNGKADTRDARLAATASNESAADLDLRSVSVGLVTGVFRSDTQGSMQRLAAAMAGAAQSTQAMPSAGTEATPVEASNFSPADPGSEAKDSPSSSSLTFGADSSWSGKSSIRYQREIARIGAQIADALDHAHKRKVIHRDIKPHNILLDALGNAWVTDFGLAKLKQEENESTSQAFAGTLRYMAPERLQGKSDGRDDIYALGATLYEFLALRQIFDGSDPHQLLSKIEHERPKPLRLIDRQIHPDLAAIIARTLAKDPTDRYATAGELRDELRRFIDGRPVKTRPVPAYARFWKWCRRNPLLAAANVAAALVTTVLAIGSTVAAKVYYDKSEQITKQAQRIEQSEIETREKLFDARAAQARASRFSHRVGQRFDSLAALGEASKIGRELRFAADRYDRLRDEAIACMALPDLKPAGPPIRTPEDTIGFAFDAAMTRYAIRLRDGTVLVRRMSDDQEVTRFRSEGNRDFYVFVFSPNGQYLASKDHPSGALAVWDVDRSALCLRDPGPVSAWAARFSPDSRRIALGHEDGSLWVYEVKSGRPRKIWHGPGPVEDLAFRPDGKQLAVDTLGSPATCRILDVDTGQLLRVIALDAHGSVAWGPDGTGLAITSGEAKISLWDAMTGQRKATLEGATNSGLTVAFHPSGTLLASNGWECRLRLWDVALGRQILSMTSGLSPNISQDGRIFVGWGNEFTPWQVDPAIEYRTLVHASNQRRDYMRPSTHRDGRILSVGTDRGLALWDLARGTELAFLPIGMVWHSMFEPSGKLLTNGSAGVLRWSIHIDSSNGEARIGPPQGLPLPGTDCAIAEDRTGQIVAVANHTEVDIALGDRTISIGPLDDCRGISISPDGQWLATANHQNGGVSIWRLPDGAKVTKLPIDGGSGVCFSPDGRWLMTTQPSCRLWEVGTWREVRQIEGNFFSCFSPDGRLGVVQDASKVLGLVEIETGRTLARLESPDLHNMKSATFSPDGSRLVVTTQEPPCAHIWDLRAIRKHLAEMSLDWDAPALAEEDVASPDLPPLPPLKIDYGPLTGHMEHYSEPPEHLVERYTARIKQDPNDFEAYHHRAHALAQLNRLADAIDDASNAIRLRPADAHLLHLRAQVYARGLRKLEPAIADLEAALVRSPSSRQVRELLAECCNGNAWLMATGHHSHQDMERALKLSLRAVELVPGQQASLNTRGVLLYRAARYAEALTTLEQSLTAGQGQFDSFDLFFLAMAHHRLGHRAEARQCFDRALAWQSHPASLKDEQVKELASFRAEAERVLAGPAGELPERVFSEAKP